MIRVMIDLETMSTRPTAAIVAIGVVVLENGLSPNAKMMKLGIFIDPNLAVGHVDPATMAWWETQDPITRKRVFAGTLTPAEATFTLRDFLKDTVGDREALYYADPSNFDFPILRHMFWEVNEQFLWKYTQERCLGSIRKTLKEDIQLTIEEIRADIPHDPISDAVAQMKELMGIFRVLDVPHRG